MAPDFRLTPMDGAQACWCAWLHPTASSSRPAQQNQFQGLPEDKVCPSGCRLQTVHTTQLTLTTPSFSPIPMPSQFSWPQSPVQHLQTLALGLLSTKLVPATLFSRPTSVALSSSRHSNQTCCSRHRDLAQPRRPQCLASSQEHTPQKPPVDPGCWFTLMAFGLRLATASLGPRPTFMDLVSTMRLPYTASRLTPWHRLYVNHCGSRYHAIMIPVFRNIPPTQAPCLPSSRSAPGSQLVLVPPRPGLF